MASQPQNGRVRHEMRRRMEKRLLLPSGEDLGEYARRKDA
jgi:hypothetical protein